MIYSPIWLKGLSKLALNLPVAFNTFAHTILLEMLYTYYSFNDLVLGRFKSHQSDRIKLVKIGNTLLHLEFSFVFSKVLVFAQYFSQSSIYIIQQYQKFSDKLKQYPNKAVLIVIGSKQS